MAPALTDLVLDDSIRFDLYQPIRVDEADNLHDGVRRADAPKELAMDCRDPLPILDADEQYSGAGHIRKLGAQSFDGGLNDFETSPRLTRRIAFRDGLAVRA